MPRIAAARRGWAYLVGAGPGDAGLLTLRGRELLETGDCVLFDRLVGDEVLEFVSAAAERIDVGKVGHGAQFRQDDIHELMVERARSGRSVVRLKGGCPTVFGRLAEEAGALRAAGVPYEIVPGVSSALAAPVSAGIAVTHRALASSLAVVSGHCAASDERPLRAVAHADTLVVLMGARALPGVVSELLACGRSPETPAAFVSRGTQRAQRVLRARLGTLCAAVERAGLGAPAVVVVGEVAALEASLALADAVAESDRSDTAAARSDIPV